MIDVDVKDKTDRSLAVALYMWLQRETERDRAQPPDVPALARKASISRLATFTTAWMLHLGMIGYGASVLGYINAPVWLWIVWAAYILSIFSHFTCWLLNNKNNDELRKAVEERDADR